MICLPLEEVILEEEERSLEKSALEGIYHAISWMFCMHWKKFLMYSEVLSVYRSNCCFYSKAHRRKVAQHRRSHADLLDSDETSYSDISSTVGMNACF